jgi:hypothetical protein
MRLLVLASSDSGCQALSAEAAQRAAKTRNCRRAYHSLAEAVQGSRWGGACMLFSLSWDESAHASFVDSGRTL